MQNVYEKDAQDYESGTSMNAYNTMIIVELEKTGTCQ